MTQTHDSASPGTPAFDSAGTRIYRAGSLVYRRPQLIALFFWLLAGDFSFYLIQQVIPQTMPLKLQELGASNLVITTFTSTLYYVINVLLNPIISFRSDRHRGRTGRRIPFMLIGTPIICTMLVLLGLSEDIGASLAGLGAWFGLSGKTTIIVVMGICLVGYYVGFMFVGTVYFYLFNDVVPPELLGRFIGMFRIVSHTASFLFSILVFPYVLSHMRSIFIGAAIVFAVSFLVMCFRVKEGEYPPPEKIGDRKGGFFESAIVYFRECFSTKLFLYFFAFMALMQASWAVNPFYHLFCRSIGLSMQQIGHWEGLLYIPGILLLYPAGSVLDRIGPHKGYLIILPIYLVYGMVNYFFVRNFNSWVFVAALYLPLNAMRAVIEGTIAFATLPRDRFGQFASANSLVTALVSIVASLGAGFFLDFMKAHAGGDTGYFRYIYIWMMSFWVLAGVFLILLYREWKRTRPVVTAAASSQPSDV